MNIIWITIKPCFLGEGQRENERCVWEGGGKEKGGGEGTGCHGDLVAMAHTSWAYIADTLDTMFPLVSITPFGFPVVPLV